ncbi:Efflux RND transporter periplasmic adaptor subunit [Gammaproteobacteria bacterium]
MKKFLWFAVPLFLIASLVTFLGWKYGWFSSAMHSTYVTQSIQWIRKHTTSQPPTPPPKTLPVEQEKPALTVQVVSPTRGQWPKSVSSSGGIYAWQEAIVAAELGGLAIISLPVDVGSVVKRGQELAQLSDLTIQTNLAQQRANVVRAKTALAEASANATRARKMRTAGALSEQLVTQALWAEESAKASLAAVEAVLSAEEVRLRQTHILAVDDGVISARTATLGAVVQVGNELFRFLRQGRLEWRAELTAAQLTVVKIGQSARLTLSNGSQIEGKIRQLAPTLDPIARKGIAYVDLPSGSVARAGMFAQGEIRIGVTPATSLPQSAVLPKDGNQYLLVLGTSGDRVTLQKVSTGRRQGNRVEILEGVAEDLRVVASGGAFLSDGDLVQVSGTK